MFPGHQDLLKIIYLFIGICTIEPFRKFYDIFRDFRLSEKTTRSDHVNKLVPLRSSEKPSQVLSRWYVGKIIQYLLSVFYRRFFGGDSFHKVEIPSFQLVPSCTFRHTSADKLKTLCSFGDTALQSYTFKHLRIDNGGDWIVFITFSCISTH